jgi:Domain of unknown function (DUF4062)
MQPRFQVFLSSTFRDLREERQAAHEAILELGHFPAGMEAFPAADATPWELIKTVIADSDYYVLIVGGKYGSTGPDGISYTEMEFDLALELDKPILVFIHGDPDQIPSGKAELGDEARGRLQSFRDRVTLKHCKTWTNKENLKSAVLGSLVYAIRTKPAFGWIRNEGLENQELLRRLALLQARYDAQESELKTLRTAVTGQMDRRKFRGLDSEIEVVLTGYQGRIVREVTVGYSDLFFASADEMLVPCHERIVRDAMTLAIFTVLPTNVLATLVHGYGREVDPKQILRTIRLGTESLAVILRQFLALGLIAPEMVRTQSSDEHGHIQTDSERCWVLTAAGRAKYLEKRALPAIDS